MSDPPPYPDDTDGNTSVEPDRGSTTGAPRWVKVFGIIGIVVVLLFFASQFTGGGGHGPDRHAPSGDAVVRTPPSSASKAHASSGVGLAGHIPTEVGHS